MMDLANLRLKERDLEKLLLKCQRQPDEVLVHGKAYSLKYKDIQPLVANELSYTKAEIELSEDLRYRHLVQKADFT